MRLGGGVPADVGGCLGKKETKQTKSSLRALSILAARCS